MFKLFVFKSFVCPTCVRMNRVGENDRETQKRLFHVRGNESFGGVKDGKKKMFVPRAWE